MAILNAIVARERLILEHRLYFKAIREDGRFIILCE